MARNMNWALDPRQPKRTATAPASPAVVKKTARKSNKTTED